MINSKHEEIHELVIRTLDHGFRKTSVRREGVWCSAQTYATLAYIYPRVGCYSHLNGSRILGSNRTVRHYIKLLKEYGL